MHGKLKAAEKNQVMGEFASGKLDILVSTPVVEVGIDIPNATIIVIEGAERFGLAQLHQLRGRVGRSDKQSFCFLYESNEEPRSNKRLEYFEKVRDGFKLALFDLQRRGGGALFGTQQHGSSEIKVASLGDVDLIEQSWHDTQDFISTRDISSFAELKTRVDEYDMKRIARN